MIFGPFRGLLLREPRTACPTVELVVRAQRFLAPARYRSQIADLVTRTTRSHRSRTRTAGVGVPVCTRRSCDGRVWRGEDTILLSTTPNVTLRPYSTIAQSSSVTQRQIDLLELWNLMLLSFWSLEFRGLALGIPGGIAAGLASSE